MGEVILKLSKPVNAHGETLNELKLREVTTEDIIRCGLPFTVSGKSDGEININVSVISKYIVHLAGIPEVSVKAMSHKDFMDAMGIIMDFFG